MRIASFIYCLNAEKNILCIRLMTNARLCHSKRASVSVCVCARALNQFGWILYAQSEIELYSSVYQLSFCASNHFSLSFFFHLRTVFLNSIDSDVSKLFTHQNVRNDENARAHTHKLLSAY